MLGSLFATGVSALSGAPLALPKRVRLLWQTVIGTALGSTFTTALLERVSSLGVSVCGLMLLSAASTASVAFIFRRFGRYDAATAFFAAVPGGLNDMTQIGADSGGDERTIALSHTVRLVLVVCVLPLTLRYFAPATSAPAAAAAGAVCSAFTAGWSLAPPDAAILLGCALLGPALGRLLRIPAPFLVGPMIASAAVHLAGWTAARPPPGLLSAAQVVVGAAVGVRFCGVRLASLRRIAALAVATTGLQLALAAAAAEALRRLTGAGFPLLLLAMAPGGITEMTLTALALGLDPSFVATHHTMRIAAVVSLTPLAFALHARLRSGKEA